MFWCGFEACRTRTMVLYFLEQKKDNRCNIYAENTRGTRVRGWIRKNTRIGPVLNIRVCYRDDRYSIEVQIPSLFQDHIVSWVRIVNGVDKNVTESMLTAKKRGHKLRRNPLQKQDQDRSPQWRWLQFLLLLLKGNGSILKHNDHMIISVMKCQKPSPDCYDMINQSHEEATERSPTVTSSKSAGRRSSTVLRNGFLKTGYQLWQKEEGRRKDFNLVWIQTLPINSCTFEQFKDIQEKVSLFLRCKTMYCYRKDLPSTSATSGTRTISIRKNGLIPGGTSLKRGRQAVFITTVNPMEDVHGIRETPCDLRKPITPCKNTWKRPQNTVFWCNLKLAQEKGLAILPNTVTCRLSLQYAACSLHWECHESCWNRTRNMVHKIHKAKKQDHLGNHCVIRKVKGN